jgi:hypothetical protein
MKLRVCCKEQWKEEWDHSLLKSAYKKIPHKYLHCYVINDHNSYLLMIDH